MAGGGTVQNYGQIVGGGGGNGGGGYYTGGSGGTGGDGVALNGSGLVANQGTIRGGAGAFSGYPGIYTSPTPGSAGGAGVSLADGGMVTNGVSGSKRGLIEGATGVYAQGEATTVTNFGTIAAQMDTPSYDSAGGAGVVLEGSGTVSNAGLVMGAGGMSGRSGSYFNIRQVFASAGGAGGSGAELRASGTVTNTGVIAAGAGGAGGYFRSPNPEKSGLGRGTYAAAAGGAGGVGLVMAAGGEVVTSGGIRGGAGGPGGNAPGGDAGGGQYYSFTAGAGGAGGDGVDLGPGGRIINSGSIQGGRAGAGGAGISGDKTGLGGAGGTGGAGVVLGNDSSLVNSGAIVGGAGAAGGPGEGGAGSANGAAGAAGAGVVLGAKAEVTNGSSVSSAGLIEGGIGVYAQGVSAFVVNYTTIIGSIDSVKLASTSDVLIAGEGAQFVGQIIGGGGALVLQGGGGTISGLGGSGVLGGTDSGTFSGFGSYVIGVTGAWALTGADALGADQSLTVKNSLVVESALTEAAGASISVASGGVVTFTGAGDSVLSGSIGGAGVVDFTGTDETLNGATLSIARMAISGGTATLEGTITSSGTVAINDAAVQIGAAGARLTGGGTWSLSDNAEITGLAAGDTLDNAAATISGSGMLGVGLMTLINRSESAIEGVGSQALVIDTGASTVMSSGLIEAVGEGGVTIQSAVNNLGVLEAAGGILTANGSITGSGHAVIVAGALDFNSAFTQDVTFTGSTGRLELAQSQAYSGTVTGFSTTGGTSLDLLDIAFESGTTKASYTGTTTAGVLTVTDGTHTAKITLSGDYLASVFKVSSDGHGGTTVVDPPAASGAGRTAAPHPFIAAMASLGASGGTAHEAAEGWRAPMAPILAAPV